MHSLDEKYLQSVDSATTGAFFANVSDSILFGPLSRVIRSRLVKSHLRLNADHVGNVSEEQVVAAVNLMLTNLQCAYSSKTSLLQVHGFRVAMSKNIPQLLRSPHALFTHELFGGDLSASGAIVLTFLILRQKLTNPLWFGDPDKTTREWMGMPVPDSSSSTYSLQGRTPALPRTAEVLTEQMGSEMADETSAINSYFHQMLDVLGIVR